MTQRPTDQHPTDQSPTDQRPTDQRPTVRISQPGGLGDLLLMTPALRALRRQQPDLHLTVYIRFPDLVGALPTVDVALFSDRHEPDSVYPDYMPCRKDRHLAAIIGRCLGVEIEPADLRPEAQVDAALRSEYAARLSAYPRPWVFVQRRIGGFTDNKNWPEPHWQALLGALGAQVTLVECAAPAADTQSRHFMAPECQADVARLTALIDVCDLFLGPVSGPLHLAAACHKPAVVIVGGFEEPWLTAYPGHVQLTAELPCAPCWVLEPCPIGKRCLQQTAPQAVLAAVMAQVHRLEGETGIQFWSQP